MASLLRDAPDVAQAKTICDDLLPKVSRSFALAIAALPEPARSYICVAYLLCRMVDTIEDHPTLAGKDQHYDIFDRCLLDIEQWEAFDISSLERMAPPQSWDDELMRNSKAVFALYASFPVAVRAILKRNVFEMSQGMRSYTARSGHGAITLRDSADLDRYCYYVAGTVGNLLTEVFAHESGITDEAWLRRQKERGYHFALGLQKVNMIKDVVADLKRGSVFVPTEWLTRFGVTTSDLGEGEGNPRVRALLLHFVREAVEHLAVARDYILDLPVKPVGFRVFCIWPYVMALDTLLLALAKGRLFTADHEIKVSRVDMFKMMEKTKRVAGFNLPLKFYFNRKISGLRHAVM